MGFGFYVIGGFATYCIGKRVVTKVFHLYSKPVDIDSEENRKKRMEEFLKLQEDKHIIESKEKDNYF